MSIVRLASAADRTADNWEAPLQNPLRLLMVSGAALALAGLGIAAPALAAPSGPPSVLHVGQIGRQTVAPHGNCEPDTLVEPDIAVSPFNTKIEVAVAHDCRFATGGAVDIFYAWTHDGGAHWHQSRLPGLTTAVGGTYPRASDPVVAFGSDGTVYISSLVINLSNCDSGVAVSRSTDGGATFADPVFAQQSTTCSVSDDKNWLVTDTQPNSPFFGRIYQFWSEFLPSGASPQVVRWSDDNGQHWSGTHFLASRKQFAQNSQAFVQPDGAITDTYLFAGHALGDSVRQGIIPMNGTNANSGTSIVAQTSFDGGAHWTKAVVVGRNIGGGPAGIRCCLPLMDGDHATGRMFQVWNANGPGVQDAVEISRSTGGQHWSSPVQVTRGHSPSIQYINAAVATAAGRVYVSYGRRNLNRPNIIQQELTWSDNGGTTFATPIALGPPSNLRWAAVAGGKFPGDYSGLSATPSRVAGAWTVSSKPPNPAAAFHQVLDAATLQASTRHH